jgi:amyloid beta precursor protein binding protein 1
MATTDKYDRQLRLWGASGQRALGNTSVVLIGSSACGTETLKNLVLPGVATFVVVDDDDFDEATASSADGSNDTSSTFEIHRSPDLTDSMFKFSSHSSNFFLPPKSTTMSNEGSSSNQHQPNHNSSRAAQASALLSELNPDVEGYCMTVPSLEGINYISFLRYLLDNPPSSSSDSNNITDSSNNSSSSDNATAQRQQYTERKLLVVSADQPSSITLPLSHACHLHSLPLLLLKSYGLIGQIRLQTPFPYHPIIDARPSHRIPDLRLSSHPIFDGLNRVVNSVGQIEEIGDSMEHAHVPYVIILLQALEKWREKSSSSDVAAVAPIDDATIDATSAVSLKKPNFPKTMAEKEEFRSIIKSMAKNLNTELNFEEALREAHMVWSDGQISDNVQMVLDRVDEESFYTAAIDSEMKMEVDGDVSILVPNHVLQFQLMVLALKHFLVNNGNYPPLEGNIPDMTSDTARYVVLQEAYKQKAEMDRLEVRGNIVALLEECQRRSHGNNIRITMPSDEEILTFCKNARYLRILETRPYFAEYPNQDPVSAIAKSYANVCSSLNMPNVDAIQSEARDDLLMSTMDPYETDPIQTPLLWWIAIRACDAFYDRHQHYPGKHDQELALEADVNEVYNLMIQIVSSMELANSDFIKEYLLDPNKGKDLAREAVRYDEAEIHTVAAVVGGVASQEAVKLITGQYVPLNDTYVYNGIASTAGVYRF